MRRFVHRVKDRLDCSFSRRTPPEINPDELVWNDVKNHGVARTLDPRPQRFASRSEFSGLKLLQKNPGKVPRVLPDGKRRVMQPQFLTYERGDSAGRNGGGLGTGYLTEECQLAAHV